MTMTPTEIIEKRKTPRIDQALPTTLFVNGDIPRNTVCKNISEGGAFIEIPDIKLGEKISVYCSKGSTIKLSISLDNNKDNLNTIGVARWLKPIPENNSYGIGVEFTELPSTEKNRLSSYIKEQLAPANKKFTYTIKAYLSDVNVFGTVYFSRYFEWQGKIREEFFRLIPGCDQVMALGIVLLTKNASMEYMQSVKLFDDVILEMTSTNIRKFSFEVVMKYYINEAGNPKNLAGIGKQTICFGKMSNPAGKMKLIPVPDPIMKSILEIKDCSAK